MSPLLLMIVLLTSTVILQLCLRWARLPMILGYLLVGVIVGPSLLALTHENHNLELISEIGVALLMFSIGLEFCLSKIISMRSTLFGVGLLQVVITILVFSVLGFGLLYFYQVEWSVVVTLACAMTMSSTAVVIKILTERRELGVPYGQQVFGILLFQDLAVVLLLIFIPAIISGQGDLPSLLLDASIKVLLVLAFILIVGKRYMGRWFQLIAKQNSNELFIINILLVVLGLSFLTHAAGLSMPLGAFLAGMLIAETDYRYQVEDDIRPFRDVLLGFFFVMMGTKLNFWIVLEYIGWVIAGLVLLIATKALIVYGIVFFATKSRSIAIRTGLSIAQGGEFGLVVIGLMPTAMVNTPLVQTVIAVMLLSIVATPFLIAHAENFALKFDKKEWLSQSLNLTQLASLALQSQQHVLICGYGDFGRLLGSRLEDKQLAFIGMDISPIQIQKAQHIGHNVLFGDARKAEVLVAAGVHRAKVVVITFISASEVLHIIDSVRRIRPDVPIWVRTHTNEFTESLLKAGASQVFPEIEDSSDRIATQILEVFSSKNP